MISPARRQFDLRLPEGWLMFGACALLAVIAIQAIHASAWVARQPDYLPAVLFSAYLGLVFSRFRTVPWPMLHLVAAVVGFAVVTALALSVLDGPIDQRVLELVRRLTVWMVVFVTHGSSTDPLPFVISISMLAWLTGYAAIWFTFRRRRIWWAILPGAAAIVVNLSYAGESQQAGYLLAFLLVALIAIAQAHFFDLEIIWRRHGISYSGAIRWLAVRDVLLFGLVVVVLAGLGPSVGATPAVQTWWMDISAPWQDAQDDFGKAFMSLTSRDTQPANVFFAESLTFRGSFNQPDVVALTIQADRPLYLKGITYTQYNGKGWVRGEAVQRSQQAGAELPAGAEAIREQEAVAQRIRVAVGKGDLVFAAGQPRALGGLPVHAEVLVSKGPVYVLRSDEPGGGARGMPKELENAGKALASLGPGAQGQLTPDQRQRIRDLLPPGYDVASVESVPSAGGRPAIRVNVQVLNARVEDVVDVRAEGRLRRGQEYTVESMISTASPDELRSAGVDYPSWIGERYTQLPGSLPPRVPALARALTQGVENPYDKARAIERHVRSLRYAEQIPPPPAEQDGVDYFLFDARAGYCDYFASAMAVMLRSVGVPARVVSGYAPGEVDPGSGVWVVKERNAHSWVEAYFPGYGWIEFEPTPSQPLRSTTSPTPMPTPGPVSSSGDARAAPPVVPEAPGFVADPAAQPGNPGRTILPIVAGLLGIALAVALTLVVLWNRGLGGLSTTERAYTQMGRLGGWARVPQRPWETPREYAQELARAIPEAAAEVDAITTQFILEQYGPRDRRRVVRTAGRRWQQLRPKLLRAMRDSWLGRRNATDGG